MKTRQIIATVAAFVVATFSAVAQDVLIIGNSYTYTNDLPSILASISDDMKKEPYIQSFARGGYSMQDHLKDSLCRKYVMRGGYDVVILQDQSVLPILVGTTEGIPVYAAMTEMVEFVRRYNPRARVMIEITWGRKTGHDVIPRYFQKDKYANTFANYEAMQEALSAAIRNEARMLKTEIADVGSAWAKVKDTHRDIELYNMDGSHPSYAGTYLAAAVIYTAIYGDKLKPNVFHGRITKADAQIIKNTVWKCRKDAAKKASKTMDKKEKKEMREISTKKIKKY